MTPRTYRVEHKHDFHPGSSLHWRLYTYGPGHWCVGEGHSGTFRSEAEADTAGRIWIETGRQPAEQDHVSGQHQQSNVGRRAA